MDCKKAAILVPTTVLAQQHYTTAMARFRGFPVNIDVLSRFRTTKQQQQTLRNLAAGSVDVIICTTKLLLKSVKIHRCVAVERRGIEANGIQHCSACIVFCCNIIDSSEVSELLRNLVHRYGVGNLRASIGVQVRRRLLHICYKMPPLFDSR